MLAEWFRRERRPGGGDRRSWSARDCSYGRSSAPSPTPTSSTPATCSTAGRSSPRPGHADGQLTLLRDGVLIAADHLLDPISPAVGLWPASRPDPLGDYLDSLRRTIELGPTISYGGHGEPIDGPGRAGARADRPSRRAPRGSPLLRSGRSRDRGTTSRSRSSATISPRPRGASPSPRRSPTSSGSCAKGAPSATRPRATETSSASPILRRSSGRASLQYRGPGGRGMTVVLELVGVAVLILLNAFFVAAEYSLVTVRRTRLQELAEEGNRSARSVMRITSDPPHFIAAMQLGVTLTSLAIGAIGEAVLSDLLGVYLGTFVAVLLAFLVITFLHVVVGELVPKGLALSFTERIALGVSVPVRAFFFVFAPLIWVLQRSSEGGAAADRDRPGPHRGRRPLGGRAEDAARGLERARRDRAGRAGDALQGLRLRRQGGLGRDGAAARGGRDLRRDGARGGAHGRCSSPPSPAIRSSASRSTTSSASSTSATSSRRCTTRRSRRWSSVTLVRPAYIVPETKDLAALLGGVPAHEPAHGGRRRRVRGDAGDRHARGPARGDRRRDRGRVRPARRVRGARRREDGADRRHVPDRRLQRDSSGPTLEHEDYHTVAGLRLRPARPCRRAR